MNTRPKQRPARLAEKLLLIRKRLGLSQNDLISLLGFQDEIIQAHVSAYERARENRVPPPGILLAYARCANVEMEVLVDDDLDLPEELPAAIRSGGIKRQSASRLRRKQ